MRKPWFYPCSNKIQCWLIATPQRKGHKIIFYLYICFQLPPNKFTQTWWLTTRIYSHRVLGTGSPKAGSWGQNQGTDRATLSPEDRFLPLPLSLTMYMIEFRAHPVNPGQSPHVKIFNFIITSANILSLWGNIYKFQGLGPDMFGWPLFIKPICFPMCLNQYFSTYIK